MNTIGRVERLLIKRIEADGVIHLTLIDPEETTPIKAAEMARTIESYGTTAIMVGGSTLASTSQLDRVIKTVKAAVKVPVILFPNSLTGISRYADAIWFMSLLNSNNTLFITGFQALGAPIIKRYGLEAIPLGYIIIGEGSTAAFIGQAHAIPLDKPEVANLYGLAAQYLGMRFVYLEAGSGAKIPVAPVMIKTVCRNLTIPVIVGGGIRTPTDAVTAAKAGASVIVTGTIGEEDFSGETIGKIIGSLKQISRGRPT